MNSKGIFNIEMIISLLIILILFSLFSSIAIGEFKSIDETQNRKESRIITTDVANIINTVYQKGDGYSMKYKLPSKINNETYILKLNDTGVYVNSHYQLTYSKIFPNILSQRIYFLEPGNVYEFINNNSSIEIVQNN